MSTKHQNLAVLKSILVTHTATVMTVVHMGQAAKMTGLTVQSPAVRFCKAPADASKMPALGDSDRRER